MMRCPCRCTKWLHQPIERIYLASDLIVLALSATYLPLDRLAARS